MAKTYKEMLDEQIRGVRPQAQGQDTAPKGTQEAVMGQPETTVVKETTETPVATTTAEVEQTTTPVVNETPAPAPVAPAKTQTDAAQPKAPSWNDLVADLGEADEEAEKRKQEILKKQRTAKAIATLGDFATHALNVWGASKSGVSAPIKGAPISDAVNAKHKEILDEHAAKLKEYKASRTEKHKGLYNEWKEAQERKYKEELAQLNRKKTEAELRHKEARSEEEKKKSAKELELLDEQIRHKKAETQDLEDKKAAGYWKKRATATTSGGSKKTPTTYTVDGKVYSDVWEAWAALPAEVREEAPRDLNGRIDANTAKRIIAEYGGEEPEEDETVEVYVPGKTKL